MVSNLTSKDHFLTFYGLREKGIPNLVISKLVVVPIYLLAQVTSKAHRFCSLSFNVSSQRSYDPYKEC
jgi:hypothetical protein